MAEPDLSAVAAAVALFVLRTVICIATVIVFCDVVGTLEGYIFVEVWSWDVAVAVAGCVAALAGLVPWLFLALVPSLAQRLGLEPVLGLRLLVLGLWLLRPARALWLARSRRLHFENEAFEALLRQAGRREMSAVLAAVDQNRRFATFHGGQFSQTLLHEASSSGHVELSRGLLDRGASLSAKDKSGWDALYYACRYDHPAVAALLLDRGADSNTSSDHWTALGWAALQDKHDLCLLLISRSANLMARMYFRPSDTRLFG